MKFKHTALFALSLNVRVIDDAGRDVSAMIAPVVYFWLWVPGWLWRFWILDFGFWIGLFSKTSGLKQIIQNRQSKIQNVLFGPGWRDDLRLIGYALRLLARDWRFADATL